VTPKDFIKMMLSFSGQIFLGTINMYRIMLFFMLYGMRALHQGKAKKKHNAVQETHHPLGTAQWVTDQRMMNFYLS
jgi:hypothetical protein